MSRITPLGSALCACFLAQLLVASAVAQDTTRLRWVPNPRVTDGNWVSDAARHLQSETVAAINQVISMLERETSAEIAVVIIDSLDGLEPNDAALLLHRRWGVGKRARDNGVVLLWSPRLRRTHVSVGYGLEGVLPDSRAGRIQDDVIIPNFRRNEFDAGLLQGVRAIAAAVRRETYAGPARARATSPGRGGGPIAWFGVPGLAILTFFAVRRRRPRCPNGHGRMRRLGEREDNAFLQREAVLEEQIGSMNYDVWVCDHCDQRKIVVHRKWFARYSNCPDCKRRAVAERSRQIVAPTYHSTGEREVTKTCKNCGWSKTERETIPMLVEASSSSSSGGSWSSGGGGSSFGGGSAGGGGAGRSY